MNKFWLTLLILIIGVNGLFSQVTEIEYHDWPYTCSFKSESGKIFINSIEDYKEVTNCSLQNYYKFENNTIIGIQGAVGGCSLPTVDFNVYKDDVRKEYIIEAIIISYGNCKRNNMYKRIIYVDSLNDNYKVIFKKLKYSR
jgi:hypothetical protein